MVARVDLRSFPQSGVAVVFGASGGVGGALVEAIRAAERFEHVVALSRSAAPSIDLLDEASLERAEAFAADRGERPSFRAGGMDGVVKAVLAQASVLAGLETFLRSEASRTARQFPDCLPAPSFPD
jgi:uncharacterized protein YbjT (DUF2867 family)